jgi:hypothetical protein
MKDMYQFGVNNLPNTTVTCFADWEDFAAAAAAGREGRSPAGQEQLIRQRQMKKLRDDGAEGARLIPLN